MDIRLILVTIAISVSFMILVVLLIRKGYLTVRYALLWFVTGSIFIVLAIFPKTIDIMAYIFGIVIPSNALFFLGLMAVLFILLALTVSLSSLSKKNTILSQEVAICEAYIRELERKIVRNSDTAEIDSSYGTIEKD